MAALRLHGSFIFCKVKLPTFLPIPLPFLAGRATLLRLPTLLQLLYLAWLGWLVFSVGAGLPSLWLFSVLMVFVFCL
jgi:hypothetical protein